MDSAQMRAAVAAPPAAVIFATGEVRDTATFAASNQLPVGIDHVLVNGVEVVTGGAWNGAAAGRMPRRGEPG
jgi:N-acyl-D-amino-acid deacylase